MGKTSAILAGVLLDLKAIRKSGGFQTDVARVWSEPVVEMKTETPALGLVAGSGGQVGSSETMTIGRGVVRSSQSFSVEMLSSSSNPQADALKLQDDVRNALERPTGNTRGVAGVELVTVTEWDPLVLTSTHGKQFGWSRCTVEVIYTYRKGEL